MSNKRTRERHLAKLASRRRAQRQRHARQRGAALVVGLAIVVFLGYMGWHTFLRGTTPTKAAGGKPACTKTVPPAAGKKKPVYKHPPENVLKPGTTYTATVETSCGTFVFKLDQKLAPHTVGSIVFLARHHFFDGLTFHRTVKGFVIQGGDPKGDGTGGPGYKTVDVPPKTATYPIGTVAMAKGSSEPAGTSGSQFFVVTSASADASLAPQGQGPQYAIVGHVTSGIDVVKTIEAQPQAPGATGGDGKPAQTIYIVKVTISES